ncbi:MAG: phage Gp37/Gp68 family protein [Rhodocyclaceae bacterium]|nr:phage Gp37/Gp68 family protein [Rhodocyclaceae bacterium]
MADKTEIAWCDSTFNPWIGCTKVGPGCDNCYAEREFDHRHHRAKWGPGQERQRTSVKNWNLPLRWNAKPFYECPTCGNRSNANMASGLSVGGELMPVCPTCHNGPMKPARRRVFCSSLADVFDNEVPDEWRADLFALIEKTPNLDWLLLTKRIGNVGRMIPDRWSISLPPNVWIGATIVNQEEADRDIPKLLAVKAGVRFISMEPLLGPVTLALHGHRVGVESSALRGVVDWVIVGGESGPKARPMHPDWVRSLRDQCASAGVPFLFKQWGEFDLAYDRDRDDPDYRRCDRMDKLPGRWINLAGGHGFNGERVHYARRVGKKAAGRLLDGALHNQFPEVQR